MLLMLFVSSSCSCVYTRIFYGGVAYCKNSQSSGDALVVVVMMVYFIATRTPTIRHDLPNNK